MNALKSQVSGAELTFWTAEAVEARLAEAAETLRHMSSDWPRGNRAQWPGEVLQGFWEMWSGLTDEERRQRTKELNRARIKPTAAQVSRMDECLDWLYGNPLWTTRTRSLLWARALGLSWRRIALEIGRDPKTLKSDYPRALNRLVVCLNG